jgi:hypothetical protein
LIPVEPKSLSVSGIRSAGRADPTSGQSQNRSIPKCRVRLPPAYSLSSITRLRSTLSTDRILPVISRVDQVNFLTRNRKPAITHFRGLLINAKNSSRHLHSGRTRQSGARRHRNRQPHRCAHRRARISHHIRSPHAHVPAAPARLSVRTGLIPPPENDTRLQRKAHAGSGAFSKAARF